MQVREIMSGEPTCCEPTTSLVDVARMMVEQDCGEIPVCDDKRKPIGVVTDRDMGERDSLLKWQVVGGASLFSQRAGARQVVCMDVGVKHYTNTPAMLLGQLLIDRRFERRIDQRRFAVHADQVRETAFAGATHLHDTRSAVRQGQLGSVPGQTPGLHSAG